MQLVMVVFYSHALDFIRRLKMRGRSYSYSPSPPRYRSRSHRSPSPRGRYAGRARDLPTSLLVRNLGRGCRPEDLRGPFGEFGPLKDVYLPRDYYTGEPRGFGFVQYVDPDDAAEAKYHMDGQVLLGRELTVVFAEENRKKPSEMRARERSRGISYDRRGSSSRYSRSPGRGRSYHRSPSYYSPSPRRGRGRSYHHSPSYYSPSPRRGHERSYHRSPSYYSPSPSRGRCSRYVLISHLYERGKMSRYSLVHLLLINSLSLKY
ncbi:putative RNA recognition motif domain, nucleotide-binding alpha-beta plait domain superfamily [Helianthus annuus]|nr:putative RNA recognition motif domain, nucleotide-binding alpha-beta plait domain superfamily [Helianthus annuus]KAJ0663223.1 putative RNA recognition motif domain, nucleotide-binding alpha-beta plait domain superfamily [Helianthus annuus]